MQCSSLMKTEVECCGRDENVESVAERMRRRNIGFLPVCDTSGMIVGTVTDRDLTVRVLGEHRPTRDTEVGQVMSDHPVYCSADDGLDVAEALMADHRKARIVCVDERKHPVGVISLSDLALVEDSAVVSSLLGAIASREAPQTQLFG